MKQKILLPSYFEDFSCIGGICEDTCCAGWTIAIDELTYKKYKKVKNPILKKRLDKELVAKKGAMSKEYVAKIKLKNNRCAFLSPDGWCDLYKELGESYLSQTCQLFPRTINQVNGTLEYSLALSCPEAARKILLNKEHITFEETMKETSKVVISAVLQIDENHPKVLKDYFLTIRKTLIGILEQDGMSLMNRWLQLEDLMTKLHRLCLSGGVKKIPELLSKASLPCDSSRHSQKEEDCKMPFGLLERLEQMQKEKKWHSPRYEQCYQEMLSGLGETREEIEVAYNKGYTCYVQPFLEENAYILENYFVNYIYERLVPLDGDTVLKSYHQLLLYKQLIMLHLAGMGNTHQHLTKERVVSFLQAFTKVFDHNELLRQQLIKSLDL